MIKKQFFHLHLIMACCVALLLSSCARKDISEDVLYDSVVKDNRAILEFLRNKNQDSGAIIHASGLVYKIMQPGNGRDTIKINNIPSVVYTRRLLGDDKIIESSLNLPTSFDNRPLRDHIAGWQIGLTLISKGGRIILYIPSYLAFGNVGVPPNIPANSILVCDISLVDFK